MDHHQSHLSRVVSVLSVIVFFGALSGVMSANAADPKPAAGATASAVKSAPEVQAANPGEIKKENPGAKAAQEADAVKASPLPGEPAKKSVYDYDHNILAHLSLGVMNFLNLGAAYAPNPSIEYGIQGGWLGVGFGNITATEWNVDALVRWHPFKGAFYLSGGARYINIRFGFPPSLLGVADPVGGTIINAAVARWEGLALVGWRWIMGKFTIGFDLGVGVPFSYTGAVTVNSTLSSNPLTAPQVASLEADGTNALRSYLGYVEPVVNFLKIGWKF